MEQVELKVAEGDTTTLYPGNIEIQEYDDYVVQVNNYDIGTTFAGSLSITF